MIGKRFIFISLLLGVIFIWFWHNDLFGESAAINVSDGNLNTSLAIESDNSVTVSHSVAQAKPLETLEKAFTQEMSPSLGSLCLFSSARDEKMLNAFLSRYGYLLLDAPEIETLLKALAALGFDEHYLPDFSQPIGVNGDASITLRPLEVKQSGVESNILSTEKAQANHALSTSYFYQQGKYYEFSNEAFNQALTRFLLAYANESQEALLLLYLHMKNAGQHYWRYSKTPDWRIWVNFEHHRQALIWLIHKYGTPQAVRRINADVLLYSTINMYSGELDRGYGPVLGARVEDAKAFYLHHLPQLLSISDLGPEPKNVSSNGMTKYDAFGSEKTRAALNAIWPEGRLRRMEDFLLALAKECHQ